MTTMQIEKRLTALEKDMARLKAGAKSTNRWWDEIAGVFADDPLFEQAVRLGRQLPDPLDRKPSRRRAQGNAKRVNGK
jgi:hypothetical protein